VAFLLQSLDQHHIDVARDVPSSTAGMPTAARHVCCTGALQRPQQPSLQAPINASTALAVGCDLYLVAMDGHVGSVVIGHVLQHHGLDSPSGH
jgi:hypothetical protein